MVRLGEFELERRGGWKLRRAIKPGGTANLWPNEPHTFVSQVTRKCRLEADESVSYERDERA
jgi:hypothetical protein